MATSADENEAAVTLVCFLKNRYDSFIDWLGQSKETGNQTRYEVEWVTRKKTAVQSDQGGKVQCVEDRKRSIFTKNVVLLVKSSFRGLIHWSGLH